MIYHCLSHTFLCVKKREEELKEAEAAIVSGLVNRNLNPIIGKVFPLSEAAAAHDYIINPPAGAIGKVLLNPLDPN